MCGLVGVCFKKDNKSWVLLGPMSTLHPWKSKPVTSSTASCWPYYILKDLILLLDIGIKKLKVTKKNNFTLVGSRN